MTWLLASSTGALAKMEGLPVMTETEGSEMYAVPFSASRKYGRKEMSLLRSDSTEARTIFPSRLTTAMDWTFRLLASALSAMTATLAAASVGFDANPTISGNRLTDRMFSRQASNWLSTSRA